MPTFFSATSFTGSVLYNLYTSTLEGVLDDYNWSLIGYADDHTLYDSFLADSVTQEEYCMNKLETCLKVTKRWMDENRLKMNCVKTEYVSSGNPIQLKKCTRIKRYRSEQ